MSWRAPVATSAAADARRAPLVMRCGAFGDMVLLTALLSQLQRRFGRRVDVIASGPWTRPLLEGHPALGELFLIRSRRMPYALSLGQQRLVRWLRARGPGPTWYCDLGVGRALLGRAGIPADYVCDSTQFPWLPGESFADRYLRLASITPSGFTGLLPPAPAPPAGARAASLVVSARARAELGRWLAARALRMGGYIVVHPGSRHIARRRLRAHSGTGKYWPEDRWAAVLRALRAEAPEHAILLSGTGAERRLNARVQQLAGCAGVRNIANELPVTGLLALLEGAHSTISIDTGPAHAAAALGCPTVALFGTAPADLYRPGGATTPAVALTGTVGGKLDIQGIAPEQVLAAWRTLTLGHAPAGR